MIRPLRQVRREAEDNELREALIECYGNTREAAVLLLVSERTVQNKMREFKISREWARKMRADRARQYHLISAKTCVQS